MGLLDAPEGPLPLRAEPLLGLRLGGDAVASPLGLFPREDRHPAVGPGLPGRGGIAIETVPDHGGATAGYETKAAIRHLSSGSIAILGAFIGRKADLLEVLRHMAEGRLRSVVDRALPLSEWTQASRLAALDSRLSAL